MSNDHSFKLVDRVIGINSAPFIIAEMSGNHNQSLERTLDIGDCRETLKLLETLKYPILSRD